jgi:hypothetical protein
MTLTEARKHILANSHDAGRVLGRWTKDQHKRWKLAWEIVNVEVEKLRLIAAWSKPHRRRFA